MEHLKTGQICPVLHDTTPISIDIGDAVVRSKSEINMLGVIFDSKFKWSNSMLTVNNRASRALNAINLMKTYFNSKDHLQQLTSNDYSVLY
jgi:hypothetical protein